MNSRPYFTGPMPYCTVPAVTVPSCDDEYTATVTRLEARVKHLQMDRSALTEEVGSLKVQLDDRDEQIAKLKEDFASEHRLAYSRGQQLNALEGVGKTASEVNADDADGDKLVLDDYRVDGIKVDWKKSQELYKKMQADDTPRAHDSDDTAAPLDKETLLADRTRTVKLSSETSLAPCPNCGAIEIKHNCIRGVAMSGTAFGSYIICRDCQMRGPQGSESETRALWNGLSRETRFHEVIKEINKNMKTHVEEFACAWAKKTGLDPTQIQLIRKEKYDQDGTHVVSFQYEPKADYSASKADRALAERVRELFGGGYRFTNRVEEELFGGITYTTEAELMGKE